MTGAAVVIRCPNCGTTQPALGECDACHEAEARYFCTSHTPGRWLDGPACPACGARHGVPAATRPAPLPPSPSRSSRPAERRPAPEPPPRRPRPAPPRVVERVEPPLVHPDDVEVRELPPWMGGRRAPVEEGWPGVPGVRVVRVGAGSVLGCFARTVMTLVALLVLAALAFFGYCGAY